MIGALGVVRPQVMGGVPASTVTPYASDDFESNDLISGVGLDTWSLIDGTGDVSGTTALSSANPHTGTYHVRMTFGPDATGDDARCEIRNTLDTASPRRLWVQWDMFIPSNYAHRAQTGSANNKLCEAWNVTYSDNNNFGLQLWPNDGTTAGSGPEVVSTVALAYPKAGGGLGEWGGPYEDYIVNDDLNSWIQVRVMFDLGTTDTALDGACKCWKNGTLMLNESGLDIHDEGVLDREFNRFYIMGWSNSGFTNSTVIDIDNVKLYDTDPGW